MKILIARRLPSIALSMDVYTDNLLDSLRKIRPNWKIIEIAPNPWSSDKIDWNSGLGFRKYYERYWNHPQNISKFSPDIVHIIDHSSAHIALWLKKSPCKVIVTCHDLVQSIFPENLEGQTRLPFISKAAWNYALIGLKSADHLISVSKNTALDLQRIIQVNSERISVIPNAVEAQFYMNDCHKTFRESTGIPESTTVVLLVGSSHFRKNVETSLVAFSKALKITKSFVLWKVGEDFTSSQKDFIDKNNLIDHVSYIGKPSKEELRDIYCSADIHLLPSIYEGFGLTILEAMACGIPVIASNTSSIPEVAGEAAILLDPMDDEAIANEIVKLHSNPGYYSIYRSLGLKQVQNFNWVNTAKYTAQVYENLINTIV